jgi:hypothetical protein
MVRRHFRCRRFLLGLAFAAIAVPIAQAQPGDAVTFGAAALLLAVIAVARRPLLRHDRVRLAST